MKKLGLLLMVVLLTSTISFAQRGGQRMSPEERAKQTTERLTKALDLKKDQEKKVYDLNLKAGKEMSAIFQDAGGDREYMREKMGKVREKTNKEMKKILSDSQWKKYEKYMEEQRNRRGQGRQR